MSEKSHHSQYPEQNAGRKKTRRIVAKVGSLVAGGAVATGLILGVGGELGKTEVAGKASVSNEAPQMSAEQLLGDAEKYALSDERNKVIAEKFDDISLRVLERAKSDPGSKYEPKGERWGELTSNFQLGATTYTLKINVAKNSVSRSNPYTVEREHKGLSLGVKKPTGRPGETKGEEASISQEFKAENDFVTPWTTGIGEGVSDDEGHGAGSFREASVERAKQDMLSARDIAEIDQAAISRIDLMTMQAGI